MNCFTPWNLELSTWALTSHQMALPSVPNAIGNKKELKPGLATPPLLSSQQRREEVFAPTSVPQMPLPTSFNGPDKEVNFLLETLPPNLQGQSKEGAGCRHKVHGPLAASQHPSGPSCPLAWGPQSWQCNYSSYAKNLLLPIPSLIFPTAS